MIELLKEMLEIIYNVWNDKDLTDEQRKDIIDGMLQ